MCNESVDFVLLADGDVCNLTKPSEEERFENRFGHPVIDQPCPLTSFDMVLRAPDFSAVVMIETPVEIIRCYGVLPDEKVDVQAILLERLERHGELNLSRLRKEVRFLELELFEERDEVSRDREKYGGDARCRKL